MNFISGRSCCCLSQPSILTATRQLILSTVNRSKRFANKLLKKMGTKERFKHPQSGDTGLALSGSNPASQARPAYSPDVFDASPKKGSKLAQRLLGKSTNSSTRLSYGSHVAGRSHHRWSDGLETAGFEPSANAADVQQVQSALSCLLCAHGTFGWHHPPSCHICAQHSFLSSLLSTHL